MNWKIIQGDALEQLKLLPDDYVQSVITSPPYWGLRDYGVDGQLGLEGTPDEYVSKIVQVFREVRRVLRKEGTLWINLGDTYSKGKLKHPEQRDLTYGDLRFSNAQSVQRIGTIPPKNLIGIPWLIAFALQADGWYLRSDIIWSKNNPMPESVKDRPTRSHEYIFLLSKSQSYYYDFESIMEPCVWDGTDTGVGFGHGTDKGERARDRVRGSSGVINNRVNSARRRPSAEKGSFQGKTGERAFRAIREKRNKRSVWTVATQSFPGAHFATFPLKLVEPCVLAGSRLGDIILDPFSGSGTTGLVALRYGRNYIGIELNQAYVEMSMQRIENDMPLFNQGGGGGEKHSKPNRAYRSAHQRPGATLYARARCGGSKFHPRRESAL